MKEINSKELKKIQLEIMNDVHNFCVKENIRYSLTAGSLLGAVRHQGYIPWDDDIDIMMPRPDYNKFISTYNNRNSKYNVVSYELDRRCPYNYAKVFDSETRFIEASDYKYNMGVNIDIFPADGYKPGCKMVKKQTFLRNLLNIKIVKINKKRSFYKNLTLEVCKILLSVVTVEQIIKTMCKNETKLPYDECDYVMCYYGINQEPFISKKLFDKREIVKFENYNFYIISEYDKWLSQRFGDYMTLPPIENQISHHAFEAYHIK